MISGMPHVPTTRLPNAREGARTQSVPPQTIALFTVFLVTAMIYFFYLPEFR